MIASKQFVPTPSFIVFSNKFCLDKQGLQADAVKNLHC